MHKFIYKILLMLFLFLIININSLKAVFLIDDFNDYNLTLNNLSLANSYYVIGSAQCSIALDTSIFHYDSGSLRIDFSVPGPSDRWGYSTSILGYKVEAYDRINFWVKGSTGGETFQITLKDNKGYTSSVPLEWVYPLGVTTTWQEIQIDFEDFNFIALDRKNLTSLYFESVPGKTGTGTFYFDEIKLVSVDKLLIEDFDIRVDKNLLEGQTGTNVSPGAELDMIVDYTNLNDGVLKLNFKNMSSLGKVWEYYSSLENLGHDYNTYNQISFTYKGSNGGEIFSVGLMDTIGNVSLYTVAIASGDTNQYALSTDITNFTGVNINKLKKLFICNYTNDYLRGTLYFDDLSFYNSSNNTRLMIDDFEGYNKDVNKLGYEHTGRKNGTSTISWDIETNSYFARDGGVLKLDYQSLNLYPNWWAWWTPLASEDLTKYTNVSTYDYLSFWVKGKNGGERFAVKFVTAGGGESSVYVTDYLPYGITVNWQKVTIPVHDFKAPGNDPSQLDFLKSIQFLNDDFTPSQGTVYIDQLLFSKKYTSFLEEKGGDSIIRRFYLSNNSFSPNNDGKMDSVFFEYVLNRPAKIYLAVYSLSGKLIRVLSKKEMTKEADRMHIIEWKGDNDSQKIVSNGLFIFQVIAEDQQAEKQKIANLIEVLK